MMLQLTLISGCMVGFEIIFEGMLEDDFTYVVVDLFIVRLTFSW